MRLGVGDRFVVAGRSGGYHENARIKLFPLSRHCLISSFPPSSLPWTSRRGRPTPRETPGVDDGVGVGKGSASFVLLDLVIGVEFSLRRRGVRPSVRDQINEIHARCFIRYLQNNKLAKNELPRL